MNVLILSLDESLFNTHGEGDTLERFKAYRKHTTSLKVIVSTQKKYKPLSIAGIDIFGVSGRNKLFSYLKMLFMTKELCKEKIDIIVANDPILGFISLLARSNSTPKIQISVFDLQLLDPNWIALKLHHYILKIIGIWALKNADSIRTDNSGDRNDLVDKLFIDPNIITTIPISPSSQSQQMFISAKKNPSLKQSLVGNGSMVLAVGGLLPKKNHLGLIDAMEEVVNTYPNLKLIIVGKGPLQENINNKISHLRLENHIKLVGSVAYNQLPSYYATTDLFVLPSLHEGFPRVIMEAALTGVPIVSTDVHGVTDLLIDGKSARIVKKADSISLASGILELLKNEKKAKHFANTAKKSAIKKLNFDKNVNHLMKSWRETIS